MKCISINCPKYQTCVHATSPLLGGNDYMYINNTSCTTLETIYACGPMGDYALYKPIESSVTTSIIRTNSTSHEPTRVCAICDEQEFESDISKHEFWLCPNCLSVLKDIIRNKNK